MPLADDCRRKHEECSRKHESLRLEGACGRKLTSYAPRFRAFDYTSPLGKSALARISFHPPSPLPIDHLRDLGRQCLAPSGRAGFLTAVGIVELRQVFFEPFVSGLDVLVELGLGEVARPAVHRLQPRAVHRQQLAPEQVELATQHHERAEHRLERGAVVAAEVGDGLEVGPQPAQQPDHLQIARRLGFQATALPHPVEVTVQVQLQHVARGISGFQRMHTRSD